MTAGSGMPMESRNPAIKTPRGPKAIRASAKVLSNKDILTSESAGASSTERWFAPWRPRPRRGKVQERTQLRGLAFVWNELRPSAVPVAERKNDKTKPNLPFGFYSQQIAAGGRTP